MPRYRQDERENALAATRQRLLQAAVQEFARLGYAETNINRVSEAAGLSKGTIYNYFASKRELMLAVLRQTAEEHIAAIAEQVKAETDSVCRLLRFFEAGFAFVERHPAQTKVMITTLYGSDTALNEYIFRLYQPMFQLVDTEILASGMEQGSFRQVDPASTSTLLMTIYLGTAAQVDENGKPYLDPAQVADFAARALHNESSRTAAGLIETCAGRS